MSDAFDRMKYRIAAVLGYYVLMAIGRSLRVVERIGRRLSSLHNSGERAIFVFWHNKLFYLSYCITADYIRKGGKVAVLISASRDGEYMARVAEKLGAIVVRGSSTRQGGEGFRKLCRLAKNGATLCVAPDGPRGPRYEPKEGVVFLAQKTGLPIIPMSYSVRSRVTAGSWDGFVLPLPFTDARVRYGKPIRVASDIDEADRKALCEELKASLMKLE